MTKTYDEVGRLTRNPAAILNTQTQFYHKLYSKDENIDHNFQPNVEKKLTNEQKEQLDKPISLEEIAQAIKQMAKNKTPGTSGFQVNLYMMFWIKLNQYLMQAFNYAYEIGQLNESARYGIISLRPKKGRDLAYVKNWRPIILLNTNYKILAKTLSNRIRKILPDIIQSDQVGFIHGKNIAFNLWKIIDTIQVAEDNDIPAIFVSIDFEKAFDRVNYQAMLTIMKAFNFGTNYLNWIQLMFTNIKLAVMNNGYTAQHSTPTRGLFQGNPLASFLFVLVIEVLATQLCKNKKIKGIKVVDQEMLLALFANDLGLLLEFNQQGWEEVVSELSQFQDRTGMLINYDKTEIYRIGSIKNTNAKFYSKKNLHWTNNPVNVLGVLITHDGNQIVPINIEPLIKTVRATLQLWEK